METFKANYVGSARGPIVAFGVTFEPGKAADVPARFRNKVDGNPYFTTNGKSEPPPPPVVDDPPVIEPYEAKHRGAGKYSIMQGDKEIVDGVTKADAEAFNAMTDEEKAAFVARQD